MEQLNFYFYIYCSAEEMKVYHCYEGAEMIFQMTSVLGLQAPSFHFSKSFQRSLHFLLAVELCRLFLFALNFEKV